MKGGARGRERARVWKKEAEPVNGELTDFLPYYNTESSCILFILTVSAATTRRKGIKAAVCLRKECLGDLYVYILVK